jgi:hypothetical protein
MNAMEVGIDGTGALEAVVAADDSAYIDSDFESEDTDAPTSPARKKDLTARILSDLSRNPYMGPMVAALQSSATYLLARMYELGAYIVKRNRIVGATADTDKLLSSINDMLHKTQAVLSGEEGSLSALGGDLFGASTEAKMWFKGTPEEVQTHYSAQVYSGGTRCHPGHGAPRRTEVLLECGMTSAITDVVEIQVRGNKHPSRVHCALINSVKAHFPPLCEYLTLRCSYLCMRACVGVSAADV